VSGAVIDPKVKSRRTVVRAALCVAYAALIAVMFTFGKGHTVIIDNKDTEDGQAKAFESVTVSVDGQEPLDLAAGDRDMAKVRGQGHKVEVTVKDQQKREIRFRVPLGEDVLLLSVPKLVAGLQPAVIPFVPLEAPPPADEPQPGANPAEPIPGEAIPGAPVAPAVPGAPAAPGAPVKTTP
jgi:hypothetical protein